MTAIPNSILLLAAATRKMLSTNQANSFTCLLVAASFTATPARAVDYYHFGNDESRIDSAEQYSNGDGDATAATVAPGRWDDLFFYNSTATGPVDRVLQAGDATKPYNSMTFRGNAGTTQINRLTEADSRESTIIYILDGGITLEPGAGPVTFGGNGQRVAIGARADFTIANNSNSDLTFHSEVRGYTNDTIHMITVSGSGSGNTVFKNIWDNRLERGVAMTINTSGTGVVKFDGTNTYKGPTFVTAGKLFINGNATDADGGVEVSPNATLGGRGEIGGNMLLADGGQLEFDLSTPVEGHKPMRLAESRTLALSGASVLTITTEGDASVGKYELITAPGGISGAAPSTLNLPDGWQATVAIESNALVLDLTSVGNP